MIEKSKRGGLTFVGAKRYAKANNKQMGVENYDPKIESSYITYVDANNLYGWAMVQSLPYKNIKFVHCPPTSGTSETCPPTSETSSTWCPTLGTISEPDPETLRTRTCSATLRTISEACSATLHSIWSETFLSTILQTADDAETGYLAEVDIEFPPEIHGILKQFPPCPETLKPNPDWFSDYQREVMEKTAANTNTEKLIPHLFKHENYVLHYRVLKFIHSLGAKITLKRAISFTQSAWLAPYIHRHNQLRTEAKAKGDAHER